MNEEEKLQKDILFQIDMQLYGEFNDKFCEMNDNLGIIYTYKDIDDLEKLEKETEIKLLRKAIEKQQKDLLSNYISIDKLKDIMKKHKKFLVNEFSHYPEDDIENRKAIQYALARLSFLLTDILKED